MSSMMPSPNPSPKGGGSHGSSRGGSHSRKTVWEIALIDAIGGLMPEARVDFMVGAEVIGQVETTGGRASLRIADDALPSLRAVGFFEDLQEEIRFDPSDKNPAIRFPWVPSKQKLKPQPRRIARCDGREGEPCVTCSGKPVVEICA